jgi:hypothetical protein
MSRVFIDTTKHLQNDFQTSQLHVVFLKNGRIMHQYQARKYDIKDQIICEYTVTPDEFYESVEQYALQWLGKTVDEETGRYGFWHETKEGIERTLTLVDSPKTIQIINQRRSI